MSKMTYDITIPVLNEERRLRSGVEILHAYLVEQGLDKRCRIVIADNGSTDKTAEIGAELKRTYSNVDYISVGKRGVGLALKTAWGKSRADVVGYMDVDLATDYTHFREVVEAFEENGAVVVNGSRNLPGAQVRNRSLKRDISSWGFNIILRLILKVKISDGMCGFKFLKRDVYNEIGVAGVYNDGWFFCTEILCLAERLGFPVRELPVRWTDDGDSRVRIMRLSLYYLREIFRLKRRSFETGIP